MCSTNTSWDAGRRAKDKEKGGKEEKDQSGSGGQKRSRCRNRTTQISSWKAEGLFKESGLRGVSCEHGAVSGSLAEVFGSHERQTAARLRDVQNTRANRLKIPDQSSFSLSSGVTQRRWSQLAVHTQQLRPVQTHPRCWLFPTCWLRLAAR